MIINNNKIMADSRRLIRFLFITIIIIIIIISWPVRTLSFSFDGQYIASASEDSFIDIVSDEKL